jgi:hypothetical protein
MIKIDFASQALAADGTANGVLTVSSAYSFNRGARVYLSATGVATKELLVNEILTATTLSVKEDHGYQYSNFDCSAYTLVLGATLTQPLQYPLEPFPDETPASTVLTDQGAPGILADAWPVLITDGLSSPAIRDGAPAGNEWGMVVRLAGGATGGTSDTFDAIFPTLGTAAGFNDGSKMQSARVFDADSGAGIEHVLGVQLRKSGAGGSVEIGTAASPIRTDPTGSTAQPITAASLPLPAGASTEATLGGVLTTAAFQARINTLGQKAMAASTPVTIASDQPAFPVTQSGVWHITNITGTVSLPTGAATQATLASVLTTQTDGSQKTQITNYPASQTVDGTVTVNQGNAGASLWKVDGSGATQPVSGTVSAAQSGAWTVAVSSSALPTGAATEATLAGKVADSTVTARLGTLGQKTMAGSAPITIASDQSALSVAQSAAPWNITNVSGTVSLPTGAATEATLVTRVAESTFTARIPVVGQKAMAASVPVVIASDQSPVKNTTYSNGVEIGINHNPYYVAISTGGGNIDAFSRLRVSSPTTLFDSKLVSDNAPLVWDDQQTSGAGATSSYNANQSSVTLSVSNLTAGTRVRQTFQCFHYQPGHSHLVLQTGVLGAATNGITSRIGNFNEQNGVFFESISSGIRIVKRSFTSGVAVDTAVAQTSWNLDKLDGTGASGIGIDWSKTQIFVIQFQWLGVGSVWYGLDVNGEIIWCHRMDNANVLDKVYMTTPNLPLRYEISNSGLGPAASMLHICSAVISEGGVADVGILRSIVRDTVLTTLNNASYYPLIAMRFKTGELSVVTVDKVDVIVGSNQIFAWKLLLNPTVAGTAFGYTSIPNSTIEYDKSRTGTTTVGIGANTIEVAGGVASQTQQLTTIVVPSSVLRMGRTIAGVSDVLVLAVSRITGATIDFYGAINFQEYV